MARNIQRYGYAPNRRFNDTVITIWMRRHDGLNTRRYPKRTPAQQVAAIQPMRVSERLAAYSNQHPGRPLTPRQERRAAQKYLQHGSGVNA